MNKTPFCDVFNLVAPAAMGFATVKDFVPISIDTDFSSVVSGFGLDSIDFYSVVIYFESIFGMDSKEVKARLDALEKPTLEFLWGMVSDLATANPTMAEIRDRL